MPRGFRIHSSAVFNPFDYQQMLAPLAQAQTAYNQMQDSLLAAGEEANQYKQLIDNDEWARGVLQGYNTALEDATDRLNREGLRGTNRNTLMRLRKTYNDTVRPVNDAAKTLAELQNSYRQAYAKDNTLMRGAMPSIRELVENPGATPQMVSGEQLYKQGAAASKAASLRQFKDTELGKELIRGYFKLSQERGYSPEVVNAFMQDASQIPELATEIANIQQMYNTAGLQDPQQANRFIMQGILDGIQYDKKVDYKYDQLGSEMRTAARKAVASTATAGNGFPVNTFNLYSQRQRSEAAKNIDKYSKYFTQMADGSFSLNDEGKKAYKASYTTQTMRDNPTINSEFNRFIKSISRDGETPENAWTRYMGESADGYLDMTRETGYRYQPQADDATVLKNILLMSSDKKGRLNTVDYDTTTQKYVETDDTISVDDIKKGTVGNIEVSDKGITVDVNNGKGTHKVMLPITNPYQYNNARIIVGNLHDIEDAMTQFALQDPSYRGSEEEQYHWMQYNQRQQELYNSIANILRTINSNPVKL